jgi:hypothetical protein
MSVLTKNFEEIITHNISYLECVVDEDCDPGVCTDDLKCVGKHPILLNFYFLYIL